MNASGETVALRLGANCEGEAEARDWWWFLLYKHLALFNNRKDCFQRHTSPGNLRNHHNPHHPTIIKQKRTGGWSSFDMYLIDEGWTICSWITDDQAPQDGLFLSVHIANTHIHLIKRRAKIILDPKSNSYCFMFHISYY